VFSERCSPSQGFPNPNHGTASPPVFSTFFPWQLPLAHCCAVEWNALLSILVFGYWTHTTSPVTELMPCASCFPLAWYLGVAVRPFLVLVFVCRVSTSFSVYSRFLKAVTFGRSTCDRKSLGPSNNQPSSITPRHHRLTQRGGGVISKTDLLECTKFWICCRFFPRESVCRLSHLVLFYSPEPNFLSVLHNC